ncbi:PAS domain-containing sensor histidine kinase [Brevibacillus ginsengisoli]|uniref:PAS domain-containing sensor histidine kinase n=1 Tax=Brevibacillus ginsengisoli TaxID=363854 RepID=UPI003CED2729
MAWLTNVRADDTSSILQSIFENVTDAILVVSNEGYVIGANQAAEKMTGYSADELLGKVPFCNICCGMATGTEELTCSDCFSTSGSMPSFEMHLKAKDGRNITIAASSSKLPEEAGSALVIILRDMSEQHRMERERHQRQITNYIIQAQEEERKRISRDLHDGVGQALYSITVGLKMVNQANVDTDLKNLFVDIQQMTARALDEVKSMAVELRPSALDDLGLIPAIRSYAKRFEDTFGIETEFDVVGSRRRFHSSIETALYRISQEAMINAAKYADTDKLYVRFRELGQIIELSIMDFGKGFDIKETRVLGTGLGLFGMKERAHLLGGQVEINSTLNKGTTIRVTIPVNEKGEPLYVDTGTYSR